ncbi:MULTISPECIES: hypothetical protein [Dyella]|uniref:Uncharacterized protein n=2 Tax=Dyella TaxID=231454 RepID=A0A4R0YSX1_9GAMM|nr:MULTISPECIES: hypothetical protein [Dyella]TBR36742.1 hypothetical protein EYV96_12565 [Dyella terrae]TCI08167.1 hypothetical protein EZM97_26305 [Dyella soli]
MTQEAHGIARDRHAPSDGPSLLRRAWRAAGIWVMLATGCASAPPTPDPYRLEPPPETFSAPLPFGAHNFWGYCFSVTDCHIEYDKFDFGAFKSDNDPEFVFPAPRTDKHYRRFLSFRQTGIPNFPEPARLSWKSLDGVRHEVEIDLAEIFNDQLIWHRVPPDNMKRFYSGPSAPPPDIFIEVNDRTVNVLMAMFIPTLRARQDNDRSFHRRDFVLAWTKRF